jgi:hypothetical protein
MRASCLLSYSSRWLSYTNHPVSRNQFEETTGGICSVSRGVFRNTLAVDGLRKLNLMKLTFRSWLAAPAKRSAKRSATCIPIFPHPLNNHDAQLGPGGIMPLKQGQVVQGPAACLYRPRESFRVPKANSRLTAKVKRRQPLCNR